VVVVSKFISSFSERCPIYSHMEAFSSQLLSADFISSIPPRAVGCKSQQSRQGG
jgi:hypothetical protein